MSWMKDTFELTGSFLSAFKVTWKNLWRKPVTISYPDQKRVLSERQRATFALLTDTKHRKKENLVLDKKRLMENQKYPFSTIIGSKIREMQAVPKPPTASS